MPSPSALPSIQGHLPRLTPEHYHGRAFVHWTLSTADRDTGWLTPDFHRDWRFVLLHTCSRYALVCPTYVVMPDHMHVLWLGLDAQDSDQRVAMAFFRKHLRPHLQPADWQHQAYDNVLRAADREHGAFQNVAQYILHNPVRKGLAKVPVEYPYLGCCVPGYPELNVTSPDFWQLFWRIYNRLVERTTRSRS